MRVAIIIRPDPEDGGYVASCPALPGCHGQGETPDEARRDVLSAIEAMVEHLRSRGEPLPPDETGVTVEVAV